MKRILLFFTVSLLIATPALANITITPNDGQNWTSAKWTFDTDLNPGATVDSSGKFWTTSVGADPWTNSSQPTADIQLYHPTYAQGWQAGAGTHTGLLFGWDATIDLHIPNIINENLTKIIQVEIIYHTGYYVPGEHGYIDAQSYLEAINPSGGGLDTYSSVSVVDEAIIGDEGWRDVTITWHIPQIYNSETIRLYLLDSGVTIDSIEVATVCVPAPGAIILGSLGVGLVGWLRRRRTL